MYRIITPSGESLGQDLAQAKSIVRQAYIDRKIHFVEVRPCETAAFAYPKSDGPMDHVASIIGPSTSDNTAGVAFEYSANKHEKVRSYLEPFLSALSEYYPSDVRWPGIISSRLGPTGRWYAGIHRFSLPTGNRAVIISTRGNSSLEEAYKDLAKQWFGSIGQGPAMEVFKNS